MINQMSLYWPRRAGKIAFDDLRTELLKLGQAGEKAQLKQERLLRDIERQTRAYFTYPARLSKPEVRTDLRNDGKPKKVRQEEPFYVSKAKRKRR